MTEVVAVFLVAALSAYVLFGGADFGGGILEATLPSRRLREKLQSTLSPVWEANHVWLIAVIVIMFVGFPRFYSALCTRMYVPLCMALLAILVRGTFFTLRKYDPDPGQLVWWYSTLFRLSSALAPLCFGFLLAGLLSTHRGGPGIPPTDVSFMELYVEPWLNPFGVLTGVFVACLFGTLAAVFFHGEVDTAEDRALLRRRMWQFFALTFAFGGAVLLLGWVNSYVQLSHALHPTQLACQAVAAAGIWGLHMGERHGKRWLMRASAGAQVLAILLGWFRAQYPVLLHMEGGSILLQDSGAPYLTQLWLVIGLVVVLSIVIPLLTLLYRVFDPVSAKHADKPHDVHAEQSR